MHAKVCTRTQSRSRKGASQIAEFAPVLYVLFFLFLMPLLNLTGIFVMGAIQYLATNDIAAKAATQPDHASALNSMTNEAYQFQSNGLAHFLQMAPLGGYSGCGDDMYVIATNIGTGMVTSSAANQGLNQPIDTKTSMFELSIKSRYSITPLVNLASVPLLGSIPGLGHPIVLVFQANRPVEHPGGLQATPSPSKTAGAGRNVVPFPRLASSPSSASPATTTTWRTPNIFSQIQAAGQTVVSVNVVFVYGSKNWQPSGVSIASGQTAWIDTSAVGLWGNDIWDGAYTANGPSSTAGDTGSAIDSSGNLGSLLGYIGTPPPVPTQTMVKRDPNMFVVGNTLTNYQLPNSGPLSFIQNWTMNTSHGIGEQQVRIIVTR